MKNIFKLLTLLFLGLSVVFFVGCEDDDADDDAVADHILTGTWDLTYARAASTYLSAEDVTLIPGLLAYTTGDTIAAGAMEWSDMQAMSIAVNVVLNNDFSFEMTGFFPFANDTLGSLPAVNSVSQSGTWAYDDAAGTFALNGTLSTLGGLLTLDPEDAPTTITMVYAGADPDNPQDIVLPVDGVGYFDVSSNIMVSQVFQFTRQ